MPVIIVSISWNEGSWESEEDVDEDEDEEEVV
jgi:hypothetical protein